MVRVAGMVVLSMMLFLSGCSGKKILASKVVFDGVYCPNHIENMEFHFTKEGNLFIWQTGIYEFAENEEGKPMIRICMDDIKRELPEDYNFSEYLITQEENSVLLTFTTEEFDLDSEPMVLFWLNGEQGFSSDSYFEGTYQIGEDGDSYQYLFHKDGSITMQVTERYFADEEQVTLIDYAGSTKYLYEKSEDTLILKNMQKEPVLTLQQKYEND